MNQPPAGPLAMAIKACDFNILPEIHSLVDDNGAIDVPSGFKGYVIYGPYWKLASGRYLIKADVEPCDCTLGVLEICDKGAVLASTALAGGVILTAHLPRVDGLEIRVRAIGKAFLLRQVILAFVPLTVELPDERLDDRLASLGVADAVVGSQMIAVDTAEALATAIAKDERFAHHLAQAYPGDIWAEKAIPQLLSWISRRSRSSQSHLHDVGSEYDCVAHAGIGGFASLPMAINAAVRKRVAPRKQACIIATARNEGVYLLDWIAHHRAVGFDGFIIYTNNNDDESDDLLEALAQAGELDLVRNVVGGGMSPQPRAYAHSLQVIPTVLEYKWASIIDLDEFIQVNSSKYSDITAFLEWHSLLGSNSVALNWLVSFPNSQCRWVDEPVDARFPFYFPDIHVKSIFNPRLFLNSHSHYPYDLKSSPRMYRYADGTSASAYPFNERPNYNDAWVCHHYYKSLEEFLERRSRGRADVADEVGRNDMLISDEAMASYLNVWSARESSSGMPAVHPHPHFTAEKDRLEQLPGVRDASEKVRHRYQRRLEDVRSAVIRSRDTITPASVWSRVADLLLESELGRR